MNEYYLAIILVVGGVLGFFALRWIFGSLQKGYTDLIAAQKASVEHHYLATSLNAVGLGLGIFLVFFMASWGELFITLGMISVLLSIVAYVGFEWVAQSDDKEIAGLQTNGRPPGPGNGNGTEFKLTMPNRLELKDGYIEIKYPDDGATLK